MTGIQTFKQIYEHLQISKNIKSLKELADITGSNYSYLSELNSGRKPLTYEFVQSLNAKMGQDFDLIEPNIASEPQEKYIAAPSKEQEYLKIIKSLADSNEILARSVEKMAENIGRITELRTI